MAERTAGLVCKRRGTYGGRMAGHTTRRVLITVTGALLIGLGAGVITYFAGVPVAETVIADAWSKRPEIENWALPHVEAMRMMLPISVLVGITLSLIASAIIFARLPTRSRNIPLP